MSRRALIASLLLALLAGVVAPPPARAWDESRCAEQLTDDEVLVRLDHIEGVFEETRAESRTWYWTWLGTYAVLGAMQVFLAVETRSPAVRDAYIFGAVGTAAALGQMIGAPLTSAFAWRRLDRLPARSGAERRAKLVEAERLLELSSRRQKLYTNHYRHLGAFLYPVTMFSYLYARYAGTEVERVGGIKLLLWGNLIGGFAVPELMFWSTPDTEIEAWANYSQGSHPCMSPALREPPEREFSLSPSPGGVGFSLRF